MIEAPRAEHGGDVMVSKGTFRKFTPVRHSGTLDEDTSEDAAEEVAA